MVWPVVHDFCAFPEFINPDHQRLVEDLHSVIRVHDNGRTVLEEYTHQTVCHSSYCLGLDWLYDDVLLGSPGN